MALTIEKKITIKVDETLQLQKNDQLEIKLNGVSILGGQNGVIIPNPGDLIIKLEGRFNG